MRVVAISLLALTWVVGSVRATEAENTDYRVFHSQPDHAWNELHAKLWLRSGADGKSYGYDRLDPLLWKYTQHFTKGDSAEQAIASINRFLAENQFETNQTDRLKRAILQRDLWAVFDWLANREHGAGASDAPTDKAIRQTLRKKLALAIRKVALHREQIVALPDNYADAVASTKFAPKHDPLKPERPFLPPRLLDDTGPWVILGASDGPVAPAHVRGAVGFSRSAFSALLRLPGGREKTLEYLKRLREFREPWSHDPNSSGSLLLVPNPKTPQFPAGTQVALVRRMLLIDSQGRLTATPITEQVQLRVYSRIEEMLSSRQNGPAPAQRFFEFNLKRDQLFVGSIGGLHAVETNEKDFLAAPFRHGFDEIERFAQSRESDRKPITSRMNVTLNACVACHREAGVLSLNTYTRSFGPRNLHPPKFFVATTDRAAQMAILNKQERYDWGLLTGLLQSAD